MDVSPVAFWRVPRNERWQPPLPDWRWAVPLFLLTLLTTTIIGARLQFNFVHHLPAYFTPDDLFPFSWVWHHPGTLAGGLSFSLPLMAILLCHELGHFLACRYYRLDATYPLFLPAPTLIGTFGAFIRIKAPFHDRQEVFDVGIAGPLAGMAVAIPVLIWGLARSFVLAPAQVTIWQHQFLEFAWPPLASWAAAWLHPGVAESHIALSPMARAGWLGLFVTMLNLVPGAQLDGGHVLYAVAPRLHTAVSWIALAALLAGGWFYWPGWYFFAAFIAVMRVRHPFVPEFAPLGRGRAWLALLALGIFLATFMAMPLAAG
jgi:membrane-associated protease RseP (regulator of RpoE activity)